MRNVNNLQSKIFLTFAGIVLASFSVLGFLINSEASDIFLQNYREGKLNLARHIANSIDGPTHNRINESGSIESPEYRLYQTFMRQVLETEEDLTYIYTIRYQKDQDRVSYGIIGNVSEYDTIWIECGAFVVELYVKDGRPLLRHDSQEYAEILTIEDEARRYDIRIAGGDRPSILVNDVPILELQSLAPLQGVSAAGVVSKENTAIEEIKIDIPARGTNGAPETQTFLFSFTAQGLPAVIPGILFVDAPETVDKVKRIIGSGLAFIDPEPLPTAYGGLMTAYAPIKNGMGVSDSVVAIDITTHDLNAFKASIQRILLFLCLICMVATIALSYVFSRWLTRPLGAFIEAVSNLNYADNRVAVDVRRKDEFGILAQRFNAMVERINLSHLDMTRLNESYSRFVPHQYLTYLGKTSITEIRLGDQVERNMTLFFADIRNFASLSESMTPAENFEFINSFLRRFSPIIRRFNGFIDKFIGDAIMAIFSQNPADAVNASILMQRRLTAYNLRLEKQGLRAVHIGIGIHSGKLMLGTVGEERRMEGTVISDVVNTASRLEGLTKAFGVKIIISGDIYDAIRSSPVYRVRYLGAIRVKGKSLPVKIYEVLNAYPREIQKRRLATRERLEAAIGSFARRDHQAARAELESILREDPDDPVARYYWQTLQEKMIS